MRKFFKMFVYKSIYVTLHYLGLMNAVPVNKFILYLKLTYGIKYLGGVCLMDLHTKRKTNATK